MRRVFFCFIATMKVSVLIPFLNAAATLEAAVASLFDQNFEDFDVILVDNGSTDHSVRIAETIAQKHANVILVNEPRKSIARALNTGLEFCSGEYIARMDADDLALPGRLKFQCNYLDQHPETGLVSGLVEFRSGMDNSEGMRSYTDQINRMTGRDEIRNFRFVESPFAHPSVMFRKKLMALHGPYTEDPVPEDYELWLRWFDAGVIMDKPEVPVLIWNDHPERASRKSNHYSDQAFSHVRLNYLSRFLKQSENFKKPIYIWGGGKLSRKKAEVLIGQGIRIDGFIDVNPDRKIEGFHVIHYLNVPPPENCLVVSLVSNRGRFREIADFLESKGYQTGRNFIPAS